MSTKFEDGDDQQGLPEELTRAQALTRLASATAGIAAAPAIFGSLAGTAFAAPQPKKLSGFKPFNPNLPAGPPTRLPKLVVTNSAEGSEYFIQLAKTVKRSVEDRGYKFSSTTFSSDVAKNVDQLTQLLERGVGALVLQPQDTQAQKAVLLKAIKMGVCVIYQVSGPCCQQIATDQYKGGYAQGLQAVAWIKRNLGGKANVVVFNSAKIAQSLIPRTTGRINALKTGGSGIRVVANQGIVKLTAEEGSQLGATIFQAHPEVNVWLGDDDTIVGVEAMLKASGKKPGDKIYLSGFNGQGNALARVKAGGLFREDLAFPNGIYQWAIGQFACDWIEGKSIPQVQNLRVVPVSKQNLPKFIADDKNPKAAYRRGVKGSIELLGNISYRSRNQKYLPGSIS